MTSACFCLLTKNFTIVFLACILSILFFRGVGVVGHRAPKLTTLDKEQQEKEETLTISKDLSPK